MQRIRQNEETKEYVAVEKKKKKDKTSEKELNKMEISNLPDMKFGHKDAHQTQEKNAWTQWDFW